MHKDVKMSFLRVAQNEMSAEVHDVSDLSDWSKDKLSGAMLFWNLQEKTLKILELIAITTNVASGQSKKKQWLLFYM